MSASCVMQAALLTRCRATPDAAAVEKILADELDPSRLTIDLEAELKVEVASDRFEDMKMIERQALVKQLLVPTLGEAKVNALQVVAMTPREFFASLKKWC